MYNLPIGNCREMRSQAGERHGEGEGRGTRSCPREGELGETSEIGQGVSDWLWFLVQSAFLALDSQSLAHPWRPEMPRLCQVEPRLGILNASSGLPLGPYRSISGISYLLPSSTPHLSKSNKSFKKKITDDLVAYVSIWHWTDLVCNYQCRDKLVADPTPCLKINPLQFGFSAILLNRTEKTTERCAI